MGNGLYGEVEGYQDIYRYEQIDFHKPIGGMGIGMMPSKLALTLINIAIGHHEHHTQNTDLWTIWDPFCGFGTTNMLANHLGYHTIGTDLNPTQAKHNRKWWITQDLATTTAKSFINKHDVTLSFHNPILHHAQLIVSEGRLGHVVTQKTARNEVISYSQQVIQVYRAFMTNIHALMQTSSSPKTIVITIPTWLKHELNINEEILSHAQSLQRQASILKQAYSRKQQLVGRSIMIAHLPILT